MLRRLIWDLWQKNLCDKRDKRGLRERSIKKIMEYIICVKYLMIYEHILIINDQM